MTCDELMISLRDENREINKIVEKKFMTVHFEALNYRPDNGLWSTAECFDHLIVTNNYYMSLIEKGLETGKKVPGGDKKFRPTVTGRLLLNSMISENAKKYKTPKIFRPESKLYTREVITYFLDQNNSIYLLLNKSMGLNLNEIKIKSSVSKLLRFNLGDCFQLINFHEKRHIRQAQRILKI